MSRTRPFLPDLPVVISNDVDIDRMEDLEDTQTDSDLSAQLSEIESHLLGLDDDSSGIESDREAAGDSSDTDTLGDLFSRGKAGFSFWLSNSSDTEKNVSTAEEKSLSIVVVGNDPSRGHWSGLWDFLMSMISYSVGLGNVWRFPYLCYKNGGGSFWIAYVIFFSLSAIPVFLMEVIVGQYLQKGAMEMWTLAPMFAGVGYGNMVISAMCVWYYCIIISWAVFYMSQVFQSEFPWETCEHDWNNEWCIQPGNETTQMEELMNSTGLNSTEVAAQLQTAVEQFWERRVLKQTDTFLEIGGVQWEILLILIACWIVIYFSMWKGITHARHFIYFCAIFPYFVIAILLGRALTLDGSFDGIKYYLIPELKSLASITLWKDAGTQVFYSYGVGFGTLIALGSHNKFNHNCYRDALLLCFINVMTSFLAGLAIFGMLGHMAVATGKSIGEVVKPGLGLTFVVYPETATQIPGKQFWAVLFFSMIIILGFDSQVCMVEGVFTGVADRFPILLKRRKISLFFFCLFFFLISLPMVTFAGVHWVNVIDSYGAAGYALLFVVFFEIVGIAWAFGADRVYACLYEMTDMKICRGWVWLWKYTSPLVALGLFVTCLAFYTPLKYPNGDYYELVAEIFGVGISCLSMICIPIYAIYYIFFKKIKLNMRERLRRGIRVPKVFVPVRTPPYDPDHSYMTETTGGSPMVKGPKQKTPVVSEGSSENSKRPKKVANPKVEESPSSSPIQSTQESDGTKETRKDR